MKTIKVIIGIIIAFFSTKTIFEMYNEESGAGLFGAFSGYIIFMAIAIWLIYSGSKDEVTKVKNVNLENAANSAKNYDKNRTDIDNLKDLKEKGILTEEEYNQKANKIEAEKAEQKLKSSTEYKQLKSLLDSGILSQEEFGKKVVLLYNTEVTLKDKLENKPLIQKIPKIIQVSFTTDKGKIEIELSNPHNTPEPGKKAFKNGKIAPDGKYKFGFMWFVHIKEGIVTEISLF